MLSGARRVERLKGVQTIVENSSGNMTFSLAALARFSGSNGFKLWYRTYFEATEF